MRLVAVEDSASRLNFIQVGGDFFCGGAEKSIVKKPLPAA
jgi:hypothetical protein